MNGLGKVQSLQSFSTFDGPGTRCVVFLQGCPVGCIFCHNPDSWPADAGEELAMEILLRRLERFRPFLRQPGLTISGGEPLWQPDFTLELIGRAKSSGWHVALDTSGWGAPPIFAKVAGQADLVICSIKHPLVPEQLTANYDRESVLANLRSLARLGVPLWLRYVLIPGWTDQTEALRAIGRLRGDLSNLERLELLPFNGLAEAKWRKLAKTSPLFNGGTVPRVTEAQLRQAEQEIFGQ